MSRHASKSCGRGLSQVTMMMVLQTNRRRQKKSWGWWHRLRTLDVRLDGSLRMAVYEWRWTLATSAVRSTRLGSAPHYLPEPLCSVLEASAPGAPATDHLK